MNSSNKTASINAAGEGKKKKKGLKRFLLDNSAKFYPIISTKKTQSLFNVGAVLTEDVDRALLIDAVNEIMERFPSLAVRVKKGYGWHYLEENEDAVFVFAKENRILKPIDVKKTNGYMFRLTVDGPRIRLDMFHALCDGTAALRFLKAILYRYRQLQGVMFDGGDDIMKLTDDIDSEETEDSFVKYYRPTKIGDIDLKSMIGIPPLRIKGTPLEDSGYESDEAGADVNGVRELSKSFNCTLTAFLAGLLAFTIRELYKSERPIVMMIPVNLRKIFPSVSMRNFVTFVRVVIKPRQCESLNDFAAQASEQLKKEATEEKMLKFVNTTVRAQNNFLMKIVPLWLKTALVKIGRSMMRSRQTIIFSNVGVIYAPRELGVKRFTLNTNVSKNNPVNCGAVTVGNTLAFNFTRAIEENDLADAFFENLSKLGVQVERFHDKEISEKS